METLLRVLVVDDDVSCANVARNILVESDYDVSVKTDSEEAFELLQDQNEDSEYFDLLLLDINMPGLDGVTLARRLRGQGVTTPILFVSAEVENGIKRSIQGMGPSVGFLGKPFKAESLVQKSTELISQTQLYVQVGRIHQSMASLEKTVKESLTMASSVEERVSVQMEATFKEHCPQVKEAHFLEIAGMIGNATDPGALLHKAKGNTLFSLLVALASSVVFAAGSFLMYTWALARDTKIEVIEVKHSVSQINKGIERQTSVIERFQQKMKTLPPSRLTLPSRVPPPTKTLPAMKGSL